MIKSELIKRLSEKYTQLNAKDAAILVDTVLETISETLQDGGRVELRGFGAFSTRRRAPRQARNPKTNEKVQLAARNSLYFRAGKELKQRINQ